MIFCGHWHILLTADFKLPPNSGHGIIAAERALYLRRAAGGKFPASVHTDTADQIRRKP